ncbi:hypothetical protein Tco_0416936 [Tanacetum coccineum]
MSSLKEDTHSIKTMMTEMYEVFKGQSSGSVTPTLTLTHIPANIEGENDTNTAIEDPPSLTEGETDSNMQEKSKEPKHSTDANIEFIGSSKSQPLIAQAQPITIINPELIIPQREGKCIATDEQVNDQRKLAHMDKKEKIKKVKEEARLFAISRPEVIKKAQDAEHEVLKRQHTEKVRKSLKLRKHKFDNYMWTINSRLKPETITDIKIHPKTKPVVITVFRGTDGRNFDDHKPFTFGERIRKIPEELGIKSALPAPAPEQDSSKSSRKKRKHMELEPEIKIPRLECNRALPENVLFVNNMVIKEPEHGIFFTDEFAASMVQSPKNARFNRKLKKLIGEKSEKHVVVWQKPPSYTEGQQLSIVNTTKDHEVEDIEKEPECASQPIPITIVRPITKPALELEMIGSSRLQLTNTILKVDDYGISMARLDDDDDLGFLITLAWVQGDHVMKIYENTYDVFNEIEQSRSVSSGTVPDPQDIERDIQLASTGLPSTLDEGTCQSKPLPGAKTMPHVEGSLGDKDSGGNIPPADMEPIHTPVVDPSGTGAKYQTFVDIQAYLLFKDELDKESDKEEVLAAGDDMNEDIQASEEVRTHSPKQD